MKQTFLLLLLLVFFAPKTLAYDASRSNNKFGIHLAQPDTDSLQDAAELVNATGGDWGYVTLVIQENDRDRQKWQNVFENLRRLHLVPIIRIATQPEGASWRRPSPEDVDGWVNFLNSLSWVVKDRYIVLFNEPNHGSEWGGAVDPVSYRTITLSIAKKLKEKNKDFFIMLAGFDASAPSGRPTYEDEETYLSQIFTQDTIKDWNQVLSGWSSHSYPNPGFVGSPYAFGRGSIRTYQWELDLLSQYGLKKLPVFITETGWDGSRISRVGVANHFQTAFESVWLPDDQVVAITPFVLDYQGEPFLRFSWKQPGSSVFFDQYYAVRDMAKKEGNPEIIESGGISSDLPKELVVNSQYHFKVIIKNIGQGYWDEKYKYHLALENISPTTYLFTDIVGLKPNSKAELDLFIKTGTQPSKKSATVVLMRGTEKILSGPSWNFEIVPLPALTFNVSLYPRLKHKGTDFELQIFDERQQLVYKKKNVAVEHTQGVISDIQNVALGRQYRVVILKPYYLPRQTFVVFKKGTNQAVFDRMLPLDFDRNGALSLNDLWALIQHPQLFTLLLP